MRVAVSGASGFVGSHVVDHLAAAGHEVVPLGRGVDGDQVRLDDDTSGSLQELLAGSDALVHLAARSVDSLATPLRAYLEPNVVLTETYLEAAAAAGVSVVVNASTRLVYPSTLSAPVSEDGPLHPDTFYGLSKLTAERLVQLHAARAGLPAVSLRLAQVVGAGDEDRGALPRMVARARRGEALVVHGTGGAVRDFVHVSDVARAVAAAIVTPTAATAFNIGGCARHTVGELAAIVADEAGVEVEHVPQDDEDTSVYLLDCTLARDALDWTPTVDVRAMVREGLGR